MSHVQVPERPFALMLAVAGLNSLGAMPAFLVGALGALMRDNFEFDQSGTGFLVAAFLVAFAMGSMIGGRIADRAGPRRMMTLAVPVVAMAALSIGAIARSWTHLVILLVAGGVAAGVMDPAANLALARGIPPRRHGLALGLKESGGASATLLAGIAVPVIGLTVGWRWTYVACAAAVGTLSLLLGQVPASDGIVAREAETQQRVGLMGLVAVAVAGGCGNGAAVAASVFLVDSASTAGMAVGSAGLLLAVSSIGAITARLTVGWLADYHGLSLGTVATMLTGGALGSLILTAATPGPLLILGALIVLATGWGWSGLLIFAVIRSWPREPGWATGVVVAGLAGGASAGPAVFGLVVVEAGYPFAWMVNAGLAISAALIVLSVRYMIRLRPPNRVSTRR